MSDSALQSTDSTTTTNVPKPVVRWKPGQSGNPAGRPKGSKNRITLLKRGTELTLREFSGKYVPHVLAVALEKALNGDNAMIKLILELHMSKPVANDADDAAKSQVQVLIQNLTTPSGVTATVVKSPPPQAIIEATVIGNNNGNTAPSGEHGNPKEYPEEHSAVAEACLDHPAQQAHGR